ncbi:GAF domain-containing sensor histidine kinase [Deinococcus ruber]|uniref:histidine kinase n=1 Tax=Deinococcus ruber TaxID=1848197 RepID=A0A918F7L6_9DEIO|nr:GAF domain-containing protein [Deinococcus ruber]GGR07990.1 hypothetical protein GCM10008957_20890 [Deinococcus ruber]
MDISPQPSLGERLQDVTESLAAATTQQDVFDVVLQQALDALHALAGAVLLVSAGGMRLELAAMRGYMPDAKTVWQEGPLTADVPAGDALLRRQVLFFEHMGALQAAYPELEERTGGVAAVASAVLPMFQGTERLGCIVLDFREPHVFSPDEQRFLRTLSAQCGIALGRAHLTRDLEQRVMQRTAQLEEEMRAQAAFVAFTETVGTETGVMAIAQEAIRVLRVRFPGSSILYFGRGEVGTETGVGADTDLWKARLWSDDVQGELAASIQAGLSADIPLIAALLKTREAVFTDNWDAEREGIEHTQVFGTVGTYPLMLGGKMNGFLLVGRRDAPSWTERDRALLRAVGQSLTLALERAEQTQHLRRQNAELDARSRALDAFAELTRGLAVQSGPSAFVQRAQEVVLSLLPAGYSVYYEPSGGQWKNRMQVGAVGHQALQDFIDAGPPQGQTPSIDLPWSTRQALYQDMYVRGTDTPTEMVQHIHAVASLPVLVYGEPVGVFIAVVFEQRAWTPTDRVVLETVVRSLGLALERAETVRQLDEERAALAAFTAFAEVVGSQTDVLTLVRQAADLMRGSRPVDVMYFVRDGDIFRMQVWTDDVPRTLLESSGYTLTAQTFAQADREHDVVFLDNWDARSQGLPESALYSAVAFQPFFRGDTMTSILIMGSRSAAQWHERDKGIFRALGRSLSLALERAEQSQQLIAQRDALDARTQALTEANEELEAFAYSVSHDLRTPVRHINGFNHLLRRTLGDKLDDKAARYLDIVEDATARMNTLIDAMLNLSRTSRQPLRLGLVDMGALLESVQAELMVGELDRRVEWRFSVLPMVSADFDLLRQVMVNLLSNALKYSRTRQPAVIEVWADERETEWEFFVRDNGVGFDTRYKDKLFGVFQRLHRQDEFEGTGVGLANVRRIVARHGGQVSAQGALNEGATFSFTLSKGE